MKKTLCLFLMALFSLSFATVYADMPAYSLGTMQPVSTYLTSPGKNASVTFYIFNAYGNRITHVILSVTKNPDNLEVELPPLETNTWNISGILTPIQENLYVEPMSLVEEKPTADQCYLDICYLRSTNVSGFIPAKKVVAKVKIPDNAVLGSAYTLTIGASASWYGELGTSQMSQARSFEYTLLIAAENYTESLYVPPVGGAGGVGIDNTTIFGVVISVLVIVILFQQFRPKKHR